MTLEFVNEPVAVEVQWQKDGDPRPMAFSWRGRRYEIASWGRRRSATQQGRHIVCQLVQTADLETWELCLDTEMAQWTLVRHWAGKYGAA